MRDFRQLANDSGIIQFSFKCAQYLLLACRAAKVSYEVGVARTHIFKRLWPGEVLRPGWDIQAFVGIDVTGLVADIIRVIVISDGMQRIHVNAAYRVDHFDEAIQPHPCVVVDGNTKILEDRETAERDAAQSICFVQLTHAAARFVDIEVARNG